MRITRSWLLCATVALWQFLPNALVADESSESTPAPADRIEDDADSPFPPAAAAPLRAEPAPADRIEVDPDSPFKAAADAPQSAPSASSARERPAPSPYFLAEEVQYFPAPQAARSRPWRQREPARQATRTPRGYPQTQVRPTEWEDLLEADDSDKLYEPAISASPAPRQSAGGRWLWLPDPREVRDNGFFSDRRAEEVRRQRGEYFQSGDSLAVQAELSEQTSGDREVRALDSLQAPAPPRQRPTARGQWTWLPAPSEIRGNGFFTPEVADGPCEIGPCEDGLCEFGLNEAARPHAFSGAGADFTLRADCPACQHARGEQAEPLPPVAGHCAAEEVADLMARRPSVTEGSVFDAADSDVDCPGHGSPVTAHDRRQAALEQLREIEAEHARQARANDWSEPRALESASTEQRVADSIRTMRETSFDLDVAAQRLEEQQLYYRADQLREFAAQLRQEARSSLDGWSLKRLHPYTHEAPVGAERDLGLELEQLRDELVRVRETLKQQANPSPRR